MKIYFSASIKGGRQLVDVYREMIDFLKTFGEVLTEHIGDPTYGAKGYASPQSVYATDVGLLSQSDLVVAEITVPSLGVGYELAYAETKKIPTLCFFDSRVNDKVSSMILGDDYFVCLDRAKVDFREVINDYVTKER